MCNWRHAIRVNWEGQSPLPEAAASVAAFEKNRLRGLGKGARVRAIDQKYAMTIAAVAAWLALRRLRK